MNPTLEKRTIEISMDNKLTIKCNGKRKLTIEYLQTHIITPFVYIFHIKCHIQLPPSNVCPLKFWRFKKILHLK